MGIPEANDRPPCQEQEVKALARGIVSNRDSDVKEKQAGKRKKQGK
jgi:hypothetical protein